MATKKITLNELRRLVKQVIKENQLIDQKENLKWFFRYCNEEELYQKMEKGQADNIEIEETIEYLKLEGVKYNPNWDYYDLYHDDSEWKERDDDHDDRDYHHDNDDDYYQDDYDSGMSYRDQAFADRSDYAREKVERGEWDDEQAAEYRAGA